MSAHSSNNKNHKNRKNNNNAKNYKYHDFYGRNFRINRNVLTPRPETEQIIDAVLSLAGKSYLPGVKPTKRQLPEKPLICDVGTGSGCIAITLALELPEAQVLGVDNSEKALQIANINKENLKARNARIFHSDLLTNAVFWPKRAQMIMDKIPQIRIPDHSHLDVVVANLPYVDKTWSWLDLKALASEPKTALFAEDHGLAFIKKLIDQSSDLKVKHLILEADPCQHDSITEYAKKKNYDPVNINGFIIVLKITNKSSS